MRARLMRIFFAAALITLILLPLLPAGSAATGDYWPEAAWRTSTPEEQGIDSAKLAAIMDRIREAPLDLRSVLIVRHGYLVLEAYFTPYDREMPLTIQSVTKSVLSALVGIALREKVLSSLDQKLTDFFPQDIPADCDPRLKNITLRHLLTMTAGFKIEDYNSFVNSPNYVRYALAAPIADDPGTRL